MSFIYDNQLVEQLIKAAQTPAPGQPGNRTPMQALDAQEQANKANELAAQNRPILDAARKMIKSLQDQASGKRVFTSEKDDTELRPVHFASLDSLFRFLGEEGIKVNGIQISYPYADKNSPQMGSSYLRGAEFDALNEQQKKSYAPYPSDNPRFYVHKNGLIAYLRDLQDKNIAILNPYIKKTIDQVNTELQLNMPYERPKKVAPQTQPAGPSDQSGVEPVAYRERGRQRTPGRPSTQDLRKLLGKLPLLEDRVDYVRIKNFTEAYKQITGQSPASIAAIDQELNKIHNTYRIGSSQGLDVDPDDLAVVLPKGSHPYNYVYSMYAVVYNVVQLLNYLKSSSYDAMDDQLKDEMDRQVGTGPQDGSSIARDNLDTIKDLMNSAKGWRVTK